jgi:hypothetical protein
VRLTTNKLIDGLQFSARVRHSFALENILQWLFIEKHKNKNEINKIGHVREWMNSKWVKIPLVLHKDNRV